MTINASTARTFLKKFGYGDLPIDDFDMFIIDYGLASDPKTDDRSSREYSGFVRDRHTLRKSLDRAGMALNDDESFKVIIRKPGKLYSVTRPDAGIRVENRVAARRMRTHFDSQSDQAERRETYLFDKLERDAERHKNGEISAEALRATNTAYDETKALRSKMLNAQIAALAIAERAESFAALIEQSAKIEGFIEGDGE